MRGAFDQHGDFQRQQAVDQNIERTVFMIGLDGYVYTHLSPFNRGLLEKYFDQAEYWLRSRTAHVVRIFTLGYVNPRAQVGHEVRKALVQASALLNAQLWWVNVQVGLRLAFGLALWATWAVAGDQ